MAKTGRPVTKAEYLSVECGFCGAVPWQQCVDKNGATLQPSKSHLLRRTASTNETEPVLGLEVLNMDDRTDAVVDRMRNSTAPSERLERVLWAINFARNIMNVPQYQIDLKLAEMIVEKE